MIFCFCFVKLSPFRTWLWDFVWLVEQRKQPELRGLPTAVVQYNEWQGGGLIAVSYEARKFGVKRLVWIRECFFPPILSIFFLFRWRKRCFGWVFRSMRGDEAKAVCPQIQLVQVPVARGKADLNLYRSAGSEVDGSGSFYFTVCVCLNNDIS